MLCGWIRSRLLLENRFYGYGTILWKRFKNIPQSAQRHREIQKYMGKSLTIIDKFPVKGKPSSFYHEGHKGHKEFGGRSTFGFLPLEIKLF